MQKNDMNKEPTNIIVIGAGTTGAQFVDNIVATLKVYNRQGQLPTNQAFIVMDSNPDALKKLRNIPDEAKIIIEKGGSVANLQEKDPDLPDHVKIVGSGGAGLVRRLGLAFYRYNRDRIQNVFIQTAADMLRRGSAKSFQVVLVAGLFGGTGSSFLVELGLDLNNWLSREVQGVREVSFTALGVLPHMSAEADYKANALAALKEVAFIRSMTSSKTAGDRIYKNPFDFFFLVATEKNQTEIDDEVEKAVTKLLIDLGIIPFRESGDRQGYTLDWNNLLTYSRNNRSEFSTFGLYTVSLPILEVKWYINTERQIGDDAAALKTVGDSVENAEKRLKAEKQNLDIYSSKAPVLAKDVSDLNIALANGYPKLLRTLEDDQKIVDDCRDSLIAADKKLEDTMKRLPKQKLQDTVRRLDEQKERKDKVRKDLSVLEADDFSLRIPISEDAIGKITDRLSTIDELDLTEVSELVGKAEEYRNSVIVPIGNNSLISAQRTLLNYRMEAPQIAQQLDAETARVLLNWGRAEKDSSGIPRLQRRRIGCAVIITSSAEKNLETIRDKLTPLVSYARSMVAERAEPSAITPNMWQHAIHFYTLLLGLPLYESDPRLPPKMEELRDMSASYNSFKNNTTEVIAKHAFLFGNITAFEELTGISLALCRTSQERNEAIAKFWADYEIVESRTKIDQIYVTLATTAAKSSASGIEIGALSRSINQQCVQPIPKQPDIINVGNVHANAQVLLTDLRKFNELLIQLGDSSAEVSKILLEATKTLPIIRQEVREQKDLTKDLLKCADETLSTTSTCMMALGPALGLSGEVDKWLLGVQKYVGKIPAGRMDLQVAVQQVTQDYNEIKQTSQLSIPKTTQQVMPNLQNLRQSLENLRREISNLR
jgi:hypothetical protein